MGRQMSDTTDDAPGLVEPTADAAALLAGVEQLFAELVGLRAGTDHDASHPTVAAPTVTPTVTPTVPPPLTTPAATPVTTPDQGRSTPEPDRSAPEEIRPAADQGLGALGTIPLMAAQGWFHTTDAVVSPGTSTTLALMVTNLGDEVEHFALTPTGMAAGWTTIRPAHITLFGGAQQSVDVEIVPPRLPGTTAGPTSLGVRIVPTANPDDVATAEVALEVAPTFDRRITVLQPAMRSRRRATFELLVENLGNVQASCRLHLIEPTSRLDGDFDPPAVGVEPGGSTLVRLRTRATRRQWERQARSVPFTVDADQTGAPTVSTTATFIQAPVLPERLWPRLAAVGALGLALAGVWFGVVRPEIQRAAEQAVNTLPAATTVPDAVIPDPAADPTATTAPTPATVDALDEGRPFSANLPSGAAPFQQSAQTYTVPAGSRLLLTQFIVQNPYGDEGSAVLRIGSIPFEYDLVNLDGIDANQGFLDPVQLAAGETITFEVSCGAVGRAGAAGCSPSATIIGRLVDADDVGI